MISSQLIETTLLQPNTGQIYGVPPNPRIHDDTEYQKLKVSMIKYPDYIELRELIVYPLDEVFIILAGNFRFDVGTDPDIDRSDFPCKVLDPDTPTETLRAYTLLDNSSFGRHDWDLLKKEWDRSEIDLSNFRTPYHWDSERVNLDELFKPKPKEKPEEGYKELTLRYLEDDYLKVIKALEDLDGSPEQIIINLLVK